MTSKLRQYQVVAQAMLAAPPPPCIKFNCAAHYRCADDGKACDSFLLYADTGKSISPRAVARRSKDDERWKVIGMNELAQPSRLNYLSLFPHERPARKT